MCPSMVKHGDGYSNVQVSFGHCGVILHIVVGLPVQPWSVKRFVKIIYFVVTLAMQVHVCYPNRGS